MNTSFGNRDELVERALRYRVTGAINRVVTYDGRETALAENEGTVLAAPPNKF